jgi:glutaredoxin
MLKNYLDRKGVAYEYIDVDEQPEKFAEVQVWSNSIIIPQLAVGMTVVVGLNLPRVIEMIDGLR